MTSVLPGTDCLLHAPNHAQCCQQSNQAHDMMQKSPDKGQHFYIFGCAPKTLLIGLRAEPDYCSPGELCDQFQEEQDQPLHFPALVVMPPSLLIFCSAKSKVSASWLYCQNSHLIPSKWAVTCKAVSLPHLFLAMTLWVVKPTSSYLNLQYFTAWAIIYNVIYNPGKWE